MVYSRKEKQLTIKKLHEIDAGSIDTSLVTTISGNHERTIYSIDWSPSGPDLARPESHTANSSSMIATAGGDNIISITHVRQQATDTQCQSKPESKSNSLECSLAYRIQGHELDVNCVRWRPGIWPPVLASAGDDGLIKLWTLSPAS